MSDPRRLRDDPQASQAMRDLLRAARPTQAPSTHEAQALKAEVARIAATPTPPPWLAAKTLAWAGGGLVLAGAGAALVLHLMETKPVAPLPAPVISVVPQQSEIKQDPVIEPAAPVERPRPHPELRRKPTELPVDTLAEETKLLDAARAALATDSAESLRQLDQHARRFPQGQLTVEREVLAVEALGRAGRTAEQRTRAEAFLQKWPQSPFVRRMRAVIDTHE